MHKITTKFVTEITLTLTEGEARALDAITGYGPEIFLKWFHKTHGQHYIRNHEVHISSLFAKCRELGKAFYEVEKAREGVLALNSKNTIVHSHEPLPRIKFWRRWQQKLTSFNQTTGRGT